MAKRTRVFSFRHRSCTRIHRPQTSAGLPLLDDCALSHRRTIEQARREGLEHVLVLEDDPVFLQGAEWVLRRGLRELGRQKWSICYLGGYARP